MAPFPSPDLTEQKRALRREMGARRARLCPKTSGRRAARRRRRGFWRSPSWRAAERVETLPATSRPRGRSIRRRRWRRSRRAGATVALPRVGAEAPRLRFPAPTPGRSSPGRFGLLRAGRVGARGRPRRAGRRHRAGPGVRRGRAAARVRRRLLRRRVRHGLPADQCGAPALIGLGYDFQIVARCPARRRGRPGRPGGHRRARAAARAGGGDDRARRGDPSRRWRRAGDRVLRRANDAAGGAAALRGGEAAADRGGRGRGRVAEAAGGARRQGAGARRRGRRSTPS